jgi:ubiquinone/menaquinone biosynthesis C-methylase UbiE
MGRGIRSDRPVLFGTFSLDGYEDVLDALVATADTTQGMKVLDLGVGTGNLAERFVRRGCTVWGVDFSASMLEKAREKLPHAHLLRGDLLGEWPLELRDNSIGSSRPTFSMNST